MKTMSRLHVHNIFISFPTLYIYLVSLLGSITAQLNSDQLPPVLWSQYSQPWSKLRGVLQAPSSWNASNYDSYSFISCEPRNEYMIRAVDFNPATKQVYWSDPERNILTRQPWADAAKWKDDQIVRFLMNDNITINGIAVDWLTGNVYATDERQAMILVTNDDVASVGSIYKVIVRGGMEIPKAISVDPTLGLIFWTDIGSNPSIQTSTMTGENRKTIPTNGRKPIGLSIDRDSKTLYWTESASSSIFTCGYDGSNPKTLYSGPAGESNRAISISQTYIYMVVESQLKLLVHSKSDGRQLFDLDIDAFPYDVTTPAELPVPPKHDCDTLNCQHLCVNLGNGKGRCECSDGYYFGVDGKACESSSPRYIYAVGSAVLMVNATFNPFNSASVSLTQGSITTSVTKAQAVDADYRQRFIHFSDTGRGSLYRINDTGGEMRELTVQQPSILGIAVHWVDQTVYWTDSNLKHIMAFKPDGRYHRIVLTDLKQPMGLSLDATNGWLYWSQGDEQKGIYRAHLDGTSKETFYNSGSTVYQQITVDIRTNRLYLSDPIGRELSWIDLESRTVQSAFSSNVFNQLYGITVFNDYLTYTEGPQDLQFYQQSRNATVAVQKSQPYYALQHTQSFDVVTYGNYLQPGISLSCGVESNRCEQHCHSVSGAPVCSCAIGFQQDGQKCKSSFKDRNVLFFTDPYHKQIYQLTPNVTQLPVEVQGIKLPLMEFPHAFEVEGSKGRVYWIDSFTRQIKTSDVKGSNERVLLDISADSTPKRLVVHTDSRLLYYTDFTRGAIYRMNADNGDNHEKVIDGAYQPYGLALDQTNQNMYWSEGKTLRAGTTTGTRLNDLGQELGNVTSLDIRSNDGLLYANDINGGRILEFNLTAHKQQRILYTLPGQQIYAVTSSLEYIYFTAWNNKGIYRVSRGEDSQTQADSVVTPVFARLTDLRYVELIAVPVVALPLPAIIGAAVGGFLFLLLLLLLLLLLGLLYRRRKAQEEGNGEPGEYNNDTMTTRTGTNLAPSSFDSPALYADQEYANIENEILPPPLLAKPPGKGVDTLLPTNERKRPGLGAVIEGESDLGATPSTISQDSETGSGVGLIDGRAGERTSGGGGSESVIAAAAAALGAQRSQNFTKKPVPPNKAPHIKKPSGFELNGNGKQASVVQRIANKLRGGISSIRFSGGRLSWSNEPSSRNSGEANSGLEGAVDSAEEGQLSKAKEPQRAQTTPNHWGFFIPPKLHQQPRGHKPASHCVPVQVKSTLGRSRGKNFAVADTEQV